MGAVDDEAEAATFAHFDTEPAKSVFELTDSTGLHFTDLALASMLISGVVGNAAWAGVVWAMKMLKWRLRDGSRQSKRKYVGRIAQLSVAAKLPRHTRTELVSCQRKGDIFLAVVRANARTYRVQFPVSNPEPSSISVDLD